MASPHPIVPMSGEIMPKQTKTPIQARREHDVVINSDPVIPIRVETLLAEINAKLSVLSTDLADIRESLHKKVDKSDFDKLESNFLHIQRGGSDVAKRALEVGLSVHTKLEAYCTENNSKVTTLTNRMVTKEAIENNNERIKSTENSTKWQWAFIVFNALAALTALAALFLRK